MLRGWSWWRRLRLGLRMHRCRRASYAINSGWSLAVRGILVRMLWLGRHALGVLRLELLRWGCRLVIGMWMLLGRRRRLLSGMWQLPRRTGSGDESRRSLGLLCIRSLRLSRFVRRGVGLVQFSLGSRAGRSWPCRGRKSLGPGRWTLRVKHRRRLPRLCILCLGWPVVRDILLHWCGLLRFGLQLGLSRRTMSLLDNLRGRINRSPSPITSFNWV